MSGEKEAGLRTGGSAKNPFIEVWRGIAVALVVYFHFTGRLDPTTLGLGTGATLPFYSGKVGVLIFFVISGYLITQSLAASRSLASFYAKRLSRIWPLFIVAALTIYLVLQLFPVPFADNGGAGLARNEPRFTDLLGTLVFAQDLGFRWVDGAFWSILVELKFYAWIGILAACWPGRFASRFAGAAFAIGFVQLALELTQPVGTRSIVGLLNRLFIADFLPFFAIGVLLCVKERGPLLTLNILLAFVQAAQTIASNPLFDAAAAMRFLLVFAGVVALDALVLRSRLFLFLGYYSYAIYLFHQMIGLTIIARLAPQIGVDSAGAAAAMVALVLAVAGSWIAEWRFRGMVYDGLLRVFSKVGLGALRVSDRACPGEQGSPAPQVTGLAPDKGSQ